VAHRAPTAARGGRDLGLLLLLDALLGVVILRGRWRQALALEHAQPADPATTPAFGSGWRPGAYDTWIVAVIDGWMVQW
jgi:hypothetical protein